MSEIKGMMQTPVVDASPSAMQSILYTFEGELGKLENTIVIIKDKVRELGGEFPCDIEAPLLNSTCEMQALTLFADKLKACNHALDLICARLIQLI